MICKVCERPIKENTAGNEKYCQGHDYFKDKTEKEVKKEPGDIGQQLLLHKTKQNEALKGRIKMLKEINRELTERIDTALDEINRGCTSWQEVTDILQGE